MKINIKERTLTIDEKIPIRTGNVGTYIIDVNADETYKDCALFITFFNGNVKRKEAVDVNNQVKIPPEVLNQVGTLVIGFYAVYKDDEEYKRYSENVESLSVAKGSYDELASFSEHLDATLEEKYYLKMKELYDTYTTDISSIYKEAETLNKETKELKTAIETSEKNAKESEENAKSSEENSLDYLNETKDIAQSMSFASFEIDTDSGELSINTPEKFGNCGFSLNDETGNLEVDI